MEIKEIKQHLPILQVLKNYNLIPNKNNLLNCPFPFHDDKTPSFQVYPETNTFHCFGCGKGGDVIEFIQLKEEITKHRAIIKAESFTNININLNNKIMLNKEKNNKPKQVQITKEQRVKALTEAFTYFTRSLKYTPKAQQYLENRALDYKKITAGYCVNNFHKEADKKLKSLEQNVGLIKAVNKKQNAFYSYFDGCIVFPSFDKQGNIVNFYGRHISDNRDTPDSIRHRYLPGKLQGLYPEYPNSETTKLIITESIIDAATLLQIEEITSEYKILACYGTNGFTEEHKKAIKELQQLKEIIFFFDGDDAGREAVKRYIKELRRDTKFCVSIIKTPDDEDINSLLIKYDKQAIQTLLNERTTITEKTNDPDMPQYGRSSLRGKLRYRAGSEPRVETVPELSQQLNTTNSDYLTYETNSLLISIWGGINFKDISKLRVTLHIRLKENRYIDFRDTTDLYSHNQTSRLISQASEKLEISTSIISQTITLLTKDLENYRQEKREAERRIERERKEKEKDIFSAAQMRKAKDFLQNPKLIENTKEMFNNIGLVGQQKNGILSFFIFLTRFFENPLHLIVMGASAAGKTHLLKTVAGVVPKQHLIVTTSISEKTLYYTPKDHFKHKILLHEDLDGTFGASLPLRELMSNQSISRLSTKADNRTGEMEQIYLHVEGPVCIAGATTNEKIFEDNANRCFLIQLDDDPEYEAKVLEYQAKEEAGLIDKNKQQKVIDLLKASQLLLKPVKIINPYAPELQLPRSVFKKMRTNKHYFTLIKSITFWNQKRRKWKQDKNGEYFIETTIEDIELTNYLSKEALLRKSDELTGEQRKFFERLKSYLKENKISVFFGKDIRKLFKINPMKISRYFTELSQRGYIETVSRSQKNGFEYRVIDWNDYEILKHGINILDKILEELRKKYGKNSAND